MVTSQFFLPGQLSIEFRDRVTAEQVSNQLTKVWDIYVKFYCVFITVNVTGIGIVAELVKDQHSRILIGVTFVTQNLIALATGLVLASYTKKCCERIDQLGARPLSTLRTLGVWAGWGSALGSLVFGCMWVVISLTGSQAG